MTPLKLFMDARPGKLPENTYPFGKNGIQYDLNGSSFNEPGFRKMAAVTPYTLMGVIETDSKPVIFSTNETDSAIGFFNPVTELYEPIVDDRPANLINWPANGERLGFKLANYITGESQRNYRGELVVSITDKVTFPKYLNCDSPLITRLDDLRLQPYFAPPRIKLTEGVGGTLASGTYYVSIGYERNDGTSTPFSEVSDQLTITPGELGNSTDKAVLITITNADTSYDFMRIAIISKVNGKTEALLLSDWVPVTDGSIDILYTGDNISEPITVAEILTPPAIYEKIGAFGQLNDALYGGDLEKEIELVEGLQMYVNMATVQWRSQLIDITALPQEHVNGQLRGMMHEETYALYIRFHKTRGGFTKAFHLPGLPLLPAFTGDSTESVAGGEATPVPKHKVEDCIAFFSAVSKTGVCGPWLNGVETYPNDTEFDSTGIGGPDLRGTPVRHHRMPSLRWCKNNLYASVPEYGRTKLDLLTLEVTNLVLPPDYINLIDGYELLYAKRTPSNMTVYGQGALLHGAVAAPEVNVPTGNANIYTSGGNWSTAIVHKGKGDYDDDWELTQLRQDTMRIHPFDVLLNRPSIEPTFISAQYKMRRDKLKTEGYLEDGAQDGAHNMPTSHLVDYTLGINPTSIPAGRTLRKIKTSFYLSIGVTVSRFNNVRHENVFAGTLAGTNWPLSYGEMGFRIRGDDYTENTLITDFEESYMVNLIALKTDIYSAFYSQRLVSAGAYKALDDFSPFKGGDTFVCDYTFHTYGRHDQVDTEGDGAKGKKVIRRIICEAVSNINLRYEIPGNEYSKWYPRTSVAYNNPDQTYITKFDRSKDPNQFGYTKDLNALNDFISSTIFNPFSEEITVFPYRIHRFGKLSRQTKARSWRTALPLDYYEMQKNMGRIINLAGMYDRLLIHMENALFITQDKAKLDAGVLSVTLGTGDIFQFEPQEAQQSKLGYAGTIHDLACVKTPVGYIFPDAKQGEIYLWAGSKPVNLGVGINTFLRDFLKINEKNSYTGNGITIGWDQKYKRLLLTVKNEKPAPTIVVKDFQDTDAFFDGLVEGDIINYNGRYIIYRGLNVPGESGFDCPADPDPPDTFAWEPDIVICEEDTPISDIPLPTPAEFTNLSSPGVLLYDGPSNLMHVGDFDQASGNFYRIHLTSGAKTYFGTPTTIYSLVKDPDNQRIFGAGLAIGLRVFNTDSETTTTVAYGTNAALSRVGLWLIGSNVVGRDITTNTLTLIDRETLAVVATRNITADIPSGSTWLTTRFGMLDVDGNSWIIPEQRPNAGIAIYSGDFSTLIGTITLTGQAVVPDWGSGQYWQSGYYDKTYGKVYIHDAGSSKTFIVDSTSNAILTTIDWIKPAGTHSIKMRFVTDPINNSLYLCYEGVDVSGAIVDKRTYILDRNTGEILQVFMNIEIKGDLERVGATEYMWTAVPGNRSWEGGSWSTDGSIIQYAHGVVP